MPANEIWTLDTDEFYPMRAAKTVKVSVSRDKTLQKTIKNLKKNSGARAENTALVICTDNCYSCEVFPFNNAITSVEGERRLQLIFLLRFPKIG